MESQNYEFTKLLKKCNNIKDMQYFFFFYSWDSDAEYWLKSGLRKCELPPSSNFWSCYVLCCFDTGIIIDIENIKH